MTVVLIVSGVVAALVGLFAFVVTRRPAALAIGFAVAVVGGGLPAVVLAHNRDKQAGHVSGLSALSDVQSHGRAVFSRTCSTCHTLAASHAVGRVGPNLDTLYGGKVPAALVLDAIQHGRARGSGQMPAGLLQGVDAQDVAAYVSAVAGRTK